MKVYLVKVSGEIIIAGETHSDVKECLKGAQLACQASQIKFLDIDKITLIEEVKEEHGHGTGAVRPVAGAASNPPAKPME